MKKLITLSILLTQMLITAAVLFVIYLMFALLDMNEIDMISGLGFLVFQPVMGIIFSCITIFLCLIIGLPIRLSAKLFTWWSARPMIIWIGFLAGAVLLLLSLNNHFTETHEIVIDGTGVTKHTPNSIMALSGWFMIAFLLLHYFPRIIVKRTSIYSTRS